MPGFCIAFGRLLAVFCSAFDWPVLPDYNKKRRNPPFGWGVTARYGTGFVLHLAGRLALDRLSFGRTVLCV